jgi:hypothetical protein
MNFWENVEDDNLHVPFHDAAEAAEEILNRADGASVVFQIFQCVHCGTTVPTMEPNAFHEFGTCAKCAKKTDLRETGCGFVVCVGHPETIIQAAADALCGESKGTA